MLRNFHVLWVLVAVVGYAAGIRAQEYSSFVVFGDSLSDSGNIAHALSLPTGSSFTTNPDPVWARIVAHTFRSPGLHSLSGGSNHAFGGACVNPDSPCTVPVPGIGQQIDQYLSSRPSGAADPDALYAVWGGANDVLAVAEAAASTSPGVRAVNPRAATLAAARAYTDHIRRLQEAGARHVVVFNLVDAGETPFARRAGDPRIPAALTALVTLYNEELDASFRSLNAGIVPINTFALFGEVLHDPTTYGFTNVHGAACSPSERLPVCGPSGSGSRLTYDPGTNRSHLFADDKHPSGAAHEIVASVVTSTLAAPVQVSLAGEAGVDAVATHRRVVSREQMSDFGLERAVGSWRGYTAGHLGKRGLDALPRLGKARSDVQAITLGASQRVATSRWWGAALSVGRHYNDVSGAVLESNTVVGSVHGAWRQGRLDLSGSLNLGRSQVDIERSIALGPAMRTEHGSTTAGQFGVDIDLGWTLWDLETSRHVLALGVSWLNQKIDGYRERGSSSTAMNFSGFDRGPLVVRGGYRITGHTHLGGVTFRPYAGVAHERELNDSPVWVTAGSNTMPGRFTASGFVPPGQWLSADVGVSASLGERTVAVVGYSGRYGHRSRGDHQLNLGLQIAF